ncbi:MAG: tRNA (adenosine(37)-N6)-threonylcarbamoyltransferase complex dimerization subunit type 1 TsaB [Chloroflexia bacterium]
MILAIDTSTANAGVALYGEAGLLGEVTWQVGEAATAQVLPVVRQLFHWLGKKPTDLSGIAVALGPGSFNGLRVGLSLGKGLARALGRPIVGLPTPEVAAYPFSSLVLPVCVLLKAGRGRVVSALFQTRYGRWQRLGDFANTTLEEVCRQTERTTVFCGEIDADMAAYLHEHLGQRALVATPALSARRAGYLAEMAWKRLQESPEGDDPTSLQPLYLSRPRLGAPFSSSMEETP